MDPSTVVPGIDVSHYQGNIDWANVAASGVKFTYVKCADGLSNPDKMFTVNMAGAKGAGLLRGAYFFLRPYSDSVAQAQVFCKLLGSDPGELPPMVDVEEAPVTGEADTWLRIQTAPERFAKVSDFVNEVVRQIGRAPVLYSRASYFAQMFGNGSALSELTNTLARHGIQSFISAGTKFDPNRHEALMQINAEVPEGVVLSEIAKGYTLNERLIRPAQVVVSKGF